MNRLWWSLVCVLALGVTSACDDNGDGGTDAGPDTSTDGGGDTEPVVQVVTARDGDGNPTEFGPADFSCMPSEPTGGDEVTFELLAESFGAP